MTTPYDDRWPVFHCPRCVEPVCEEAEACACGWAATVVLAAVNALDADMKSE